jgi:hypothetical protein
MGPFHFNLPPDLSPAARAAAAGGWLLNGYDHTPVPAKRTCDAARLSLLREDVESSHLAVAWPSAAGLRTVASATLRPRPEVYQFVPELARGAVNRIRCFVQELAAIQVALPDPLAGELAALTRGFGRAILGTGDVPEEQPAAVLEAAGRVADGLAALLTAERYRTRTHRGPLDTRVGCRLSRPLSPDDATTYAATFNAVRIVPDWNAIEPTEAGFNWSTLDPLVRWATDAGLEVSIGPIIDVADGAFPQWLRAWRGDVPTLTAFLSDFVATVVARYRQPCRVWQLLNGFNHADALGLGEDDRVKLAARLLETAREVDPDGTWLIGLSQPWGDYLAKPGHAYSPFVLVDTLLRAGFDLGGLELEVLSGPTARCSSPRDALDVIQLLESYDTLGVPLNVALGRPLPDPAAVALAETCLAAPTVHALYWDSFTADDPACRVPGSGLLAAPDTLAEFLRLRTTRLA